MDRVMSIKVTEIVCFSFILLLLLKVTVAYPYGDTLDSSESDINSVENKLWDRQRLVDTIKQKRGCVGFPCVYTHMAERAGRASVERYIARLIEDCMVDPECNPGRRRRSLRNLQHKDS